MQQEDDLRGLAKVMEFMRVIKSKYLDLLERIKSDDNLKHLFPDEEKNE